MKIFVVLACALALASAKSRRQHYDLQAKASDYGEQVAYSGHAGGHGGVGVPVSQLVSHEDVQIAGYGSPLQLHPLGHGGQHGHGAHGHAGHGHGALGHAGHGHGALGHAGHGHVAHGHAGHGGRVKHAQEIFDNIYHGGGGGGHGGGLALLDAHVAGGGHGHIAHGAGHLDLAPEISKSVFVFSAPPDPSDLGPRTVISRVPYARPQKHYQVVFINAPTPPPPPQHKLELPPNPELKTLVYVLVKKPEKAKPIKVIKPLPRPPSKPEVYFIRYMNKHKHHHLGHGEPPYGPEIHHPDYAVQDGPSHYGPPGGPLGEPMGPDYVDESYGHGVGSENRLRSLAPAELDAGISGI